MSEDLTVLLVGDDDPDEKLIEQLEKQGLVVEFSNVKEFSSLLALVEPHIVVHVGKAGAEQTTRLLKEAEIVRRVRLVIMASRDELPSLRDLDRSVVVSLLASDIAPSVIAARVLMLAKKGPEKSLRPPKPSAKASSAKREPAIPLEAPPPPEASVAQPASPKAAPPRAASKAAQPPPKAAQVSKTAPLSSNTPEPARAAPRPTFSKAASQASPQLSQKASPASLPHSSKAKAPPSSKSGAKAAPPPLPAPPPPGAPPASSKRTPPTPASEKSPPPPASAEDFSDENTVVYEAPLPLTALASPTPRILVADSDVTRADLIACALRRAGLEARITPVDAAATHWNLIRGFAPTIVLGDAAVFQTSGHVWLQLLKADQALKKAKLVQAPFGRLFDVHNGSVNLRTLVPQIPQLSGEVSNEAKPTRGPTPPPSSPRKSDDEDKTPSPPETIAPDDEDFESEFERLTVSHPNDFAVPKEARSSYPPPLPGAAEVEPVEQPKPLSDIGELELESLPPTVPPENRSEGDFRNAPTLADTESAPTSETPRPTESPVARKKSRGLLKGALAALVLGGTVAGVWLGMGKSIGPFSVSSLRGKSANHAPPRPSPPAPAQALKEPPVEPAAPKEAQPAEEPADPLWVIPGKQAVKTCEEVVVNLEELKVGGIQQASLSWAKAQKTMVIGDLDKAQVLMCEAVLIHPESLALEGLATLYLSKRDPKKAKRWIDLALVHRPKRSQTLEVASDVYSQLGEVDAAKKALADALNVDLNDQRTLDQVALQYLEQANLSLRSGALERAELLYRRAATISPTNADAAAGMAAIHAQAGTTEGAQLWAEKTLALDDSNPVALVVQASLAAEGGDVDRAIELCKRAIKRDPTYLPAIQLLAKLEE